MLFDSFMLLVSLGIILFASYVFTNAVELLGFRMGMHQGATGSILAAVGTALPETIIPIIAILFYRDSEAVKVGIGAIAGAPFMLATLGFFVTGAAVLYYAAVGRRSRAMQTDRAVIGRDLTFFVAVYSVAVLTTFVHHIVPLRWAVAIGLLLSYVWYVRQTLVSEGQMHEELNPLHLARMLGIRESLPCILVQVVAALALMTVGAHLFVGYVKGVALGLGMSTLILSMIVTPVATELPEKLNSVIWTGQRKDTLALGNITGAMVFQSSFPVVFGILFTPWSLHGAPLVSALLALGSAILLLLCIRLKVAINPFALLVGGVFYGLFIVYICR